MNYLLDINIAGLARAQAKSLEAKLDKILKLLEKIMATNAELAQSLNDLKAQADKARQEIVDKVAALEAAIQAGGTTPEVDAALAALKGSVQSLDDLNPDVPPAPPPGP